MNSLHLIKRSLLFYRRMHLGVLLGTAICTAILVGALTVGDSVRYSLQYITHARLGKTEYALSAGDRFFRLALATDLTEYLKTDVVPIIQAHGIVINMKNQVRVNAIQINGIDNLFWTLWNQDTSSIQLAEDETIINQRLAERLGLNIGDELLVRVEKINQIPQDIPLASNTETSVSFRLTIKTIAGDDTYGRFSLRSNQIAPYNLFMSISRLADVLDIPNRANMLLVAGNPQQKLSLDSIHSALKNRWELSDASLELRYSPEFRSIELTSDRLFLDPPVTEAGKSIPSKGTCVLTYFVNAIRSEQYETPYSFVSAIGDSIFSASLKDDEIIINKWLADDIHAVKGDQITLSYFIIGPKNNLMENQSSFNVKEIVHMEGITADRTLMPKFPGLAEAEHCREWDPGIPIDLNKIRDKDETYWDMYRGTPKAFISLSSAQQIWKNRFGDLTAIRYMETEPDDIETISNEILKKISPVSLGLIFYPVKELGIKAGTGAVDFGQLFLGLSFFIILAALLLTSLLFMFGIENRSEEIGTLMAIGFSEKQIKYLQLIEGFAIALSGSILGILLSFFYNL
ncbi:ABC transporter permease, partial [bacterium]|nr:ABC transporter permease [bacterium]